MITAVAEMPFRLAGGSNPLVLLDAYVNGKGPFPFVLDTGSGKTLVASQLATHLALNSVGSITAHGAGGRVSLSLAIAKSIAVGPVRVEGIEVGVTDELERIGAAVNDRIVGNIGFNFLSSLSFTLDYERRRLRWNLQPAAPLDGLLGIPFRLAHPNKPLILVEARLNGRGPYSLVVDTGASASVLAPRAAGELGIESAPGTAITGGGGSVQIRMGRLSSLSVGPSQIDDLPIIVGDFMTGLSQVVGVSLDGIIGFDFLRRHEVTIDYPNRRMLLEEV